MRSARALQTASAIFCLAAAAAAAASALRPGALRDLLRYFRGCDPVIPWDAGDSARHGIAADALDAFRQSLIERNTTALLIVQYGTIVEEWYRPGGGPGTLYPTASLTKSLIASPALLAVLADGSLALDDPAWKYVPSWREDPLRSRITVRHLATHSSGLDDGRDGPFASGSSTWQQAFWRDRSRRSEIAIADAPVVFPPGERVRYSGPGFAVLASAVTRALGDRPQRDIHALLDERLMTPLGIPACSWQMSYGESYPIGDMVLYDIAAGASFTARAAARIGQLLLDDGQWREREILDPDWVMRATAPAVPPATEVPPERPLPGLGWWTNANGVWPRLPRDAFAGAGRGHQIVLVVPSWRLVLVRFGGTLGATSPYSLEGDFWDDAEELLFDPLADLVAG